MSQPQKRATRSQTAQDPRRYANAGRKREAEKVNAITALQRASRRCARHLGAGCIPGLLELVAAELGGTRDQVQ